MKKIVGILGMAAVLATSAFALDFSTSLKVSGDILGVEDGKFRMFNTDGGISTGDKVAFSAADDVAGASMEFKVVDTSANYAATKAAYIEATWQNAYDATNGAGTWAKATAAEKAEYMKNNADTMKVALAYADAMVDAMSKSFNSTKVLAFNGVGGKIWVKPFADSLEGALKLTAGNIGKLGVRKLEFTGDTIGFTLDYDKGTGFNAGLFMNAADYWAEFKNGASVQMIGAKAGYKADFGTIGLALGFDQSSANYFAAGVGFDLGASVMEGLTAGFDVGTAFNKDGFINMLAHLDLGFTFDPITITTNEAMEITSKGFKTLDTKLDVGFKMSETLSAGVGAKATFNFLAPSGSDMNYKLYGTNAYAKIESSNADWFKPHLSVNFNDWTGDNPTTTKPTEVEAANLVINLGISGNIGVCAWTLDMNHKINHLTKAAKYSMEVPFTMAVAF